MKFDFCNSNPDNDKLKGEYVNQLWSTVNDRKCNVNIGTIDHNYGDRRNGVLVGFGLISLIYLGYRAYKNIYKPIKEAFTDKPNMDVKSKRSDLLMIGEHILVLEPSQYEIIEDDD